MKSKSAPTQPFRRERGRKRVESLLRSAERVFAEVGYERATTNLIAERASASPGTLYQFFSNKQEMAEEIAHRYAKRLRAIQSETMVALEPRHPHKEIDRVVDAYLEFLRAAPAFGMLLETIEISREVSAVRKILLDSAIQWITQIIAALVPDRSKADQRLHAEVCVMIFRGMTPMLVDRNTRKTARAVAEVKKVIHRYLAPVLAEHSSR
ncbi:MAG TPA: TetR/AcrR family transcriptional regulator [Clostridia bacterium]|nr:TetR/AcrR family transcriptional regulator [Clostridia bacterium]